MNFLAASERPGAPAISEKTCSYPSHAFLLNAILVNDLHLSMQADPADGFVVYFKPSGPPDAAPPKNHLLLNVDPIQSGL
jgi:hypothetical protein